MTRKRYWSKKYPICLKNVKLLNPKSTFIEKSKVTSSLSTNFISPSPNSNSQGVLNSSIQPNDENSSLNIDNASPANTSLLDSNTLILFSRTDREKEEWFRLFKKSAAKTLSDSNEFLKRKKSSSQTQKRNSNETHNKLNELQLSLSYSANSDKIIYKMSDKNDTQSQGSVKESNQGEFVEECSQTDNGLLYDTSLSFMNIFLIRIFEDFFTHKFWISKIKQKIQNKLNTIKVPHFMEELKVTDLDLGSVVPLIKQSSEPWYDEKGLWVHLDIDYSGGIQIMLSTKLNLMKLKSNNPQTPQQQNVSLSASNTMFSFRKEENSDEATLTIIGKSDEVNEIKESQINGGNESRDETKKKKHPAITDSDEEDSADSSGDEYVHGGIDEENKLIET